MNKFLFTSVVFFIGSQFLFSQHIDIDKKALSFLASQERVNVVFAFDSLTFDAENIPETEFLQKRYVEVSEWKDTTAAKEWIALYHEHKNNQWQELFLKTLNERMSDYKKPPEFIRDDSTAQYTMRVNTDWMYFGYNVIVGKQPSKVSVTLSFFKTETPLDILFNTEISRAMGTNNESYNLRNWPSFRRMGKAYTKAAYKLGQSFGRIVD